MVLGGTPVETVNRALNLTLDTSMADTFSGLLMALSEKVLTSGDRIDLPGAVAEVISVKDRRSKQIRVTIIDSNQVTKP
jgi:CBS domain containing-hemolysin-like protein